MIQPPGWLVLAFGRKAFCAGGWGCPNVIADILVSTLMASSQTILQPPTLWPSVLSRRPLDRSQCPAKIQGLLHPEMMRPMLVCRCRFSILVLSGFDSNVVALVITQIYLSRTGYLLLTIE